ncbi:Protease synthase and sporulation protein PAI 2 [Mycobacterium marinum]|uniref:Protease synthase and sporulation protein PAI 2 n=1 Tax=Mycobacterium marinum TaxID=1781 RepID=A0A3E2MUS0_MYCMR|nr:FMN-binding negative transcriptional regulator [Mycobacterium marinum]RFZ40146.1 Protease synthase and sporulation protein PAI 2 [Mycobacterium marinum]GJO37533.1 transcriptional regulator [Mycobacterium marinum]
MYERPGYSAIEPAAVLDLLTANPLGLVVTIDGARPLATHAPVLFSQGPNGVAQAEVASGDAPLVGSLLVGHMNADNPQWRGMQKGGRVLVAFQGPHGYVSPSVYGVTPASPTWNFTAVHIAGTLEPIADPESTFELVCDTARRLEARFGHGWRQEPSLDYFRRIVSGVGAFEIQVESVQTMFKLSQEQPPVLRRRVAEHFESSDSVLHQELADLMRKHVFPKTI